MELSRCLSRDEAKSIFSCIRNNVRPPKSLRFRIIVVPNDALKLSPPAFDYEGEYNQDFALSAQWLVSLVGWISCCRSFLMPDGIYVVVRAERETPIEIPSNLIDMVLPDSELALKPSCQWSISGPQNSRSHRMNQRYCYPRGQRDYSRNRGGWEILHLIPYRALKLVPSHWLSSTQPFLLASHIQIHVDAGEQDSSSFISRSSYSFAHPCQRVYCSYNRAMNMETS